MRIAPSLTRRALVSIVISSAAFCLSACGSGQSSAPPSTVSNPGPSSTISTPTTTAAAVSPELVFCSQGQYFAIPPGSSASVSPLVTVNQDESTKVADDCTSLSSDLTKVAATESEADGSMDAGYVTVKSGQFTDLSGHSTNYSGSTATDTHPTFAPGSGDLWWMTDDSQNVGGTLNFSSIPGGTPSTAGSGNIGGFTPSGEASPEPIYASPSGDDLGVIGASVGSLSGPVFSVGPPTGLTGSCLEADWWFSTGFDLNKCQGVASGSVPCPPGNPPMCPTPVGLINDSTALFFNSDNSFEILPFSISGATLTFGSPTQLTPPTQQKITDAVLSPDGQTLWFLGTQISGADSAVYEVPTSHPTSAPPAFTPTLSTSSGPVSPSTLSGSNVEVGWYWKGAFSPILNVN